LRFAIEEQSRLDSDEEGLTLLWGEILDHHLVMIRQRAGTTQQLLDRNLKVLLSAVVRRMR
jgi:hypothetical protein